jgi:hypothetical protein
MLYDKAFDAFASDAKIITEVRASLSAEAFLQKILVPRDGLAGSK